MIECHPIAPYTHGCYVTSMSKNVQIKALESTSNSDSNIGFNDRANSMLCSKKNYKAPRVPRVQGSSIFLLALQASWRQDALARGSISLAQKKFREYHY